MAATFIRIGPHGFSTVYTSKLVFEILPLLTLDACPATCVAIFPDKFEFVELTGATTPGRWDLSCFSGPDNLVCVYRQSVCPASDHLILVGTGLLVLLKVHYIISTHCVPFFVEFHKGAITVCKRRDWYTSINTIDITRVRWLMNWKQLDLLQVL